jgi:hypothetical protein
MDSWTLSAMQTDQEAVRFENLMRQLSWVDLTDHYDHSGLPSADEG